MRKLLVMLSLFAVLGLSLSSPAMAATYDLAADFSADQNPNGVWSYGWTESRGSTFQLATIPGQDSSYGTIIGWRLFEGIMSPAYAVTDWNHPTVFIPAGTVNLHPGPLGENSVVRWTAPSAGTYTIQGWFDGNDFSHPTSTDVAIRHGTAEIFTGAIDSYNVPLNFSLTRQLNAGDTIDFAVGYGSNGNYFNDSTGISATIIGPTDNTPPVITPDVSGTQGDNGWYTSDVTVGWTVSDDESQITSRSGCDTTTITEDTAGTTLTCEATSAGGTNEESVTIKRDATAPTLDLPPDITEEATSGDGAAVN